MRLTRRGWVVLAAVVLAFGSAAVFGPRGLNAVVAPGVVALVAAVWQNHRFIEPAVSRELPERGERGTTVPVRLTVSTRTPRGARVVDAVPASLTAEGADRTLSIGGTTIDYDLELTARGRHTLGPVTVVARDVLGLIESEVRLLEKDAILVHPRVHPLVGHRRAALARLTGAAGEDRQAFSGLRRYRRGDPLRDIHWKSSARQADGELVVRQFATEERGRTVEVAAEAAPGAGDAMAEAAASLAVGLAETGVRVGLTTPDGRVASDDAEGARALLDHLATVEAGSLPADVRRRADVHVEATGEDVRVSVGGVDHDFAALSGTRIDGDGGVLAGAPR